MKNLILVTFILIGGSAIAQNSSQTQGKNSNETVQKDKNALAIKKTEFKSPSVDIKKLVRLEKKATAPRKLKKAPQRIFIREELHKK